MTKSPRTVSYAGATRRPDLRGGSASLSVRTDLEAVYRADSQVTTTTGPEMQKGWALVTEPSPREKGTEMSIAESTAQNPLPMGAALRPVVEEPDAADVRLSVLRKRGSGINLLSKRSTTGRMTRILKRLSLTPTLHGQWCGLGLKEWLARNPTWTEREWARLVAENFDAIKGDESMTGTGQ